MNIEFNIENIRFLLERVLEMEFLEENQGRYHYYKVCGKTDITGRKYFIDVWEENGLIFLNRIKLINEEKRDDDLRKYKIANVTWLVFLDDLVMRTFSASDSFDSDYMKDGMKGILREEKIDELLSLDNK